MDKPTIFWFRQDLRLADLPGLQAAAQCGPVIPVFVWDEVLGGEWAPGGASRWWLHHSLTRLRDALAKQNCRLVLRKGRSTPYCCSIAISRRACGHVHGHVVMWSCGHLGMSMGIGACHGWFNWALVLRTVWGVSKALIYS